MSIDSNTTITKIVCNHVRREEKKEEKSRRKFRFAIKNMKEGYRERERDHI